MSELNQRAVRAQLLGEFDEQADLIDQLGRFAVDSDVERDRVYSIIIAQSGILAFDRGDLADYVDVAVAFADEQPETTQRQVNAAFVLAWTGNTNDAWRFYRPIVESELRGVTTDQSMGFMLGLLGWAAFLLQDPTGAGLVEQRLLPFGGRTPCYFGGSLGPTDFSLGHCALARGDRAVAATRFDSAINLCAVQGLRPFGARARLARGVLRSDMDDAAGAEVDVRDALSTATSLGMAEVAAAAKELLDQLDAG